MLADLFGELIVKPLLYGVVVPPLYLTGKAALLFFSMGRLHVDWRARAERPFATSSSKHQKRPPANSHWFVQYAGKRHVEFTAVCFTGAIIWITVGVIAFTVIKYGRAETTTPLIHPASHQLSERISTIA
ncbi:MAG: hypothetical protein QM775_03720 [Pirellulales bacterium]